MEPDVILLDNPTSGLDPLSTATVEDSLIELKSLYTIIMVPHSVQQAARGGIKPLSDGRLVDRGGHRPADVCQPQGQTDGGLCRRTFWISAS